MIDFGIGAVGVEVGRLFAENGADVIKVESRNAPDFIRVVMGTEMNPSFASSNRCKRSFGANVTTPEGLELVKRLIADADVLIENSATGVMAGLGLGWDVLHDAQPAAGDGEQPADGLAWCVEGLAWLRPVDPAAERDDVSLELARRRHATGIIRRASGSPRGSHLHGWRGCCTARRQKG